MIYFESAPDKGSLSDKALCAGLQKALRKLGSRNKVLVIPPDITRLASRAGDLTQYTHQFYGDRIKAILPALGTHRPMTPSEKPRMFGAVPSKLFRVHNWRGDVETLGEVPSSFVKKVSGGALSYTWPVQTNRLLVQGGFDLILSIGQIVPHEVVGMAGFTKNILVGTGGPDGINRSHFLGAVYGMERIMGRTYTPVRKVLSYAHEHFLAKLPIVYVLTVISTDGRSVLGLFVGDDPACFERAARLSQQKNITLLPRPLKKVVAYCSPDEYQTTWLANKSIYRTRMALADKGELVVLAPGLERFGESPVTDRLILQHGYCGTPKVLRLVKKDPELAAHLGVAAHLIHGSTEGRFRVTYCPGKMTQADVEKVGYQWGDLRDALRRYDPKRLTPGPNTLADGEEIFLVPNPGLGLWSTKKAFRKETA